MHTDDMNDLVLMGLARDAAEAEAKALRSRLQELEAALSPFAIAYDIAKGVLGDMADIGHLRAIAAQYVHASQFARARAALQKQEGGHNA